MAFGKTAKNDTGPLCEKCIQKCKDCGLFTDVDEAADALSQSATLKMQWKHAVLSRPEDVSAIHTQAVSENWESSFQIYVDCICCNGDELKVLGKKLQRPLTSVLLTGGICRGAANSFAVLDDLPAQDTAGY